MPVTPFGSWSWDFSDLEAAELLKGFRPGGVLVSHSPPKGCLDVDSSGESRGSESVRDTIRVKHPALVVCGHIHACGGKTETFHGTTVVNAGPSGVVIELPAVSRDAERSASQVDAAGAGSRSPARPPDALRYRVAANGSTICNNLCPPLLTASYTL